MHARKPRTASLQAGITLVELMISITLGLFVVLAATSLLLTTKAGYVTQDEGAQIQDNGRHAIEIIARAVRQAGFENWDSAEAPIVATASMSANVVGFDASRLNQKSAAVQSPLTKGIVNGSDILVLRFFGTGDGAILNCAGFSIPAATSAATADGARGWSIFYVAEADDGEPKLYCKYLGKDEPDTDPHWTAAAIASGVESFQVLYGVDTNDDGLPNQFLNADTIYAADASSGSDSWKKVVVVKVALLLRGSQNARADKPTAEYDLFGPDYANEHAATDIGTRITETDLPVATRNNLRKTFTATIQLRNQPVRNPT